MNQETYTKYYNEVPKQIFSLVNVFKNKNRLMLFIIILKEESISFKELINITGYLDGYLSYELNDLMLAGAVQRIGELSEDNYKQYYQPTVIGKLVMKKLIEAVLFID